MGLVVVGLGVAPEDFSGANRKIVDEAQVLVGGKRHLQRFKEHDAEQIAITSPLSNVFEKIEKALDKDKNVVVLATGDPLFFGIGKTLIEHFSAGRVEVAPNVSVLQAAAAKLKIPWNEVAMVSLHGRNNMQPLFEALMEHERVAALTDEHNIPSAMAQALLDKGVENYRLWIFENLGEEDERIGNYSLAQANSKSFSSLNLVMFERMSNVPMKLRFGIPDEDFTFDNKLLTKGPIRAAGLSALRLEPGLTMWDLGAGSGSMSIEAAAIMRKGQIIAVEKNTQRIGNIRENIRRFGALIVEAVHGTMPRCIGDLPEPDRIFIGGGLHKDIDIVDKAADRLKPGGRMVVHCILLDTLAKARKRLSEKGFSVSVRLMQSASSRHLADDLFLEGLNPVFIISARKPSSARQSD